VSRFAFALLVGHLVACGGDDGGGGGDPPLFPADYGETYQQVRNCRPSVEHGPIRVRVLADPGALGPYNTRTAPFPVGAVLLKEEYQERDLDCSKAIVQYTVMQKLAAGSAPATLDWSWQTVDAKHHAVVEDIKRCTNCHTDCGKPPEGYDGTCTVP
jgi:hypothetical protein